MLCIEILRFIERNIKDIENIFKSYKEKVITLIEIVEEFKTGNLEPWI